LPHFTYTLTYTYDNGDHATVGTTKKVDDPYVTTGREAYGPGLDWAIDVLTGEEAPDGTDVTLQIARLAKTGDIEAALQPLHWNHSTGGHYYLEVLEGNRIP
jgi:hypothetical protein